MRRLLPWYDHHRRDLPWRVAPSPYRTLLSELMLQQTRVDTVIPYFRRFVARWPTLQSLASADDDDVLAAWAGLGYYRRARSLLAAARAASALGGLPNTAEALCELPGVGPYTAGAIASIAFGQVTPVVDGNVHRVLARYEGWGGDFATAAGRRHLWARAAHWVDPRRPGDHNQALMELGATVCTPRRWDCASCPVREGCVAHREGTVAQLPFKRARKPPQPIEGVAAAIFTTNGVVLVRRPARGLLGGMWELPGIWPAPASDPGTLLDALLARLGVQGRVMASLGVVEHVFSHRRLRLALYEVHTPTPPLTALSYYTDLRCGAEGAGVALPTLTTKALRQAQLEAPLLAASPGPGTLYQGTP